MSTTTRSAAPWHALETDEVMQRLGTDPENGLDESEALRRLGLYGRNELEQEGGFGRLQMLANQFRDVMIWILLAAAAVSGFLLDEWIDSWVIFAIVVLNAVLGYVQEWRAEGALEALKELSAPEAVAIRQGLERSVPGAELVPGDLVVLEAGDRVPADGRLLQTMHLETDESVLTGESFSVEKTTDAVAERVGLGDRRSIVFAGTTVAAGRGRMVVVETARTTEMGRVAEMLEASEPPTPLQIELARVGRRLAVLALVTAGIVFVAGWLRGTEPESMLLIAVALAVAAIPEGLPAVVTITLSRGVTRMAREQAIVRRLPAVEALGAASVICTDKTGTLTRNEIRVQTILGADLGVAVSEADPGDRRIARYAEVASLCNDARAADEGYLGDPTEVALLISLEQMGIDAEGLRTEMPRVDELAFDSGRKRMTTLHRRSGTYLAATKGAPEIVASLATHLEGPDGPEPLDPARRERALQKAAQLAEGGLRTLALAYRVFDDGPGPIEGLEENLVLVAVVGMSDEARPEAAPAVQEAQAAGIRVVMVTGDHEVTARAIATEVGILREGDEVMAGADLRRLSADELAEQVERYSVYARVDPADKVKIVDAWQARDQIVAMTGDGVNDAPALRAADIGVAMGTGTDVAKDASSMVLADDNFATIISAVREGRAIFANLRKVVHFLLSANASEVLVMLIGFLAFGFLGEPLVAVQLLWINLVTDGLPAIALGIDPAEAGIMSANGLGDRNILSLKHQVALLSRGAVLAAGTLGALVIGHYVLDLPFKEVQTAVFTTLVLVQVLHLFNVRAERTVVWRRSILDNPWVVFTALISIALQLAVVYLPLGNTLFDVVPLGWEVWPVMIGLSVVTFAINAWIKQVSLKTSDQ
ncbi:MAG: cation-translocating P-type ATPase [Acidimicrobiia bacterium]|nr:cation-translocating P-type ATPase [Acidimicrobiia bacterium]